MEYSFGVPLNARFADGIWMEQPLNGTV